MKKLQKHRKSSKTRKILTFALVAGLTLLPGCRTSNSVPNQFKNKQPMVDNMENKEDLSKIVPKKKGEKKEEPKKIKEEEKKEEKSESKKIKQTQKMQGVGPLPAPPIKLKKVKRIH